MNVSQILHEAADDLERNGWARGIEAMSVAGPHCLEGAIQAASGGEVRPDRDGEYDYVSGSCPAGRAVREYLGLYRPFLFTWNDHPDRTAAEVIETLRACALIEAARESAHETGDVRVGVR